MRRSETKSRLQSAILVVFSRYQSILRTKTILTKQLKSILTTTLIFRLLFLPIVIILLSGLKMKCFCYIVLKIVIITSKYFISSAANNFGLARKIFYVCLLEK